MFRVSCIQLKSNNNILHNLKKTERKKRRMYNCIESTSTYEVQGEDDIEDDFKCKPEQATKVRLVSTAPRL